VSKWPMVRIEDLCEAVNVGFVGPSSDARDAKGIPFLMGKNIGAGFLKLADLDRVTPEFHDQQRKSQLRGGDIIVVRIGNSGQAALVPYDFGPANCAGLVIIKQPQGIDPNFLVYYLNSPAGRAYSLDRAGGSTRQTLNTKTVAQTPVPLPPLDEQKRIVAKLDEANSELDVFEDHHRRLLEAFDELATVASSRCIAESLDGVVKSVKLGSLGQWITGSTPPTSESSSFDGNVPFLTPGDIGRVGEIFSTRRSLSQSGLLKSRLVSAPSVNLVCIGATLGKVGWSSHPTATNQQITSIHLDPTKHDPEYLMWRLASAEVQQLLVDSSSTNTIPLLNKSNLMEIALKMPSIGAQRECVRRLTQIHECAQAFHQVGSDLTDHADHLRVAMTRIALVIAA
jgi:type I restriction enzyme S subunit